LAGLLWVGLRCAPEMLSKGPSLLDRLMALPTGEPDGRNNECWQLCQELGWAGRHGYLHESIVAVIEWADAIKDRRMIAVTILESVDDADAAEFVARVWAEVDYRGGLRQSPTTLSTGELKHHAWSPQDMTRLQHLWSDDASDGKLRREAFGMWLEGASHEQFQTIVAANEDAVLFRRALQWRVKFGDQRVTPMLVKEARAQPFWWRLAHHVWNSVVRTAIEEAIAGPNDDKDALWTIADLLCDIPTADADVILLKNDSVLYAAASLLSARLPSSARRSYNSWLPRRCHLGRVRKTH
jgi:hypothetical protein